MATHTTHDDSTDTQLTLEAATIRARYDAGQWPDEIATAVDADLESVARTLRRAGTLAAYDDPRVLAHLYHDHDYTLAEIADSVDHARGPESIRTRMQRYGIERRERTLAEKLADPEFGPEDAGLSPTTTDDYAHLSKRGERA